MKNSLSEIFDFKEPTTLPPVKNVVHRIFKQSDRLIIHDKKYGYVIGYLYQYAALHRPMESDEQGNVFVSDGSFYLNEVTGWAFLPKKAPIKEVKEPAE